MIIITERNFRRWSQVLVPRAKLDRCLLGERVGIFQSHDQFLCLCLSIFSNLTYSCSLFTSLHGCCFCFSLTFTKVSSPLPSVRIVCVFNRPLITPTRISIPLFPAIPSSFSSFFCRSKLGFSFFYLPNWQENLQTFSPNQFLVLSRCLSLQLSLPCTLGIHTHTHTQTYSERTFALLNSRPFSLSLPPFYSNAIALYLSLTLSPGRQSKCLFYSLLCLSSGANWREVKKTNSLNQSAD